MNTAYQFALVGMSGRGKTMAFRNMDPETTGYINMENKPLPYLNTFKHYSTPNNWQECYQKIIEYAKDSSIKVVIVDSFSAYIDSVLKTARDTKRGFDIWNYYNEEIGKFLYVIQNIRKHIIMTAHYEWVETEEGAVEKRIMVKGKL
jgi:archaellum biogenesis ATPase FlaH